VLRQNDLRGRQQPGALPLPNASAASVSVRRALTSTIASVQGLLATMPVSPASGSQPLRQNRPALADKRRARGSLCIEARLVCQRGLEDLAIMYTGCGPELNDG